MPGVIKILFASNIPGHNSFMPPPAYQEKVFCDDFVDYAGQSIGKFSVYIDIDQLFIYIYIYVLLKLKN